MVHDSLFMAAYQRVVSSLASKCVFGYFDQEDIAQEIYILCRSVLPSFDPARASGPDEVTKLANFFFVHSRNKLANLKRNLFHRADPPCMPCASGDCCTPGGCLPFIEWKGRNASKSALFQASSGDGPIDHERSSEDPSSRDLIRLIEERLPPEMRSDWLRLQAGARFHKGRRGKLVQKLTEILDELKVKHG